MAGVPRELTAARRGGDMFPLLDRLRGAGFVLGVGDYLRVQAVVDAYEGLAAEEQPSSLKTWLAPVLCTSLEQQATFYRVFDEWRAAAGVPDEEVQPEEAIEGSLEEVVRWSRPWPWVVLAVVLLLGLLGWMRWLERDVEVIPTSSEGFRPPPQELQTTDGELLFELDPPGRWVSGIVRRADGSTVTGASARLTIERQGKGPTARPAGAVAEAVTNARGEFEIHLTDGATATLALVAPPLSSPPPWTIPAADLALPLRATLAPGLAGWRAVDWRAAGQVFAMLWALLLLLWQGWRSWRLRLVMERRQSRRVECLTAEPLPEPEHELFRGPAFTRARVGARRRRFLGRGELDAAATVEASLRRGGWMRPVWEARRGRPLYLALVDRSHLDDHQAALIDRLLDELVDGGVEVERLYFDGDPRFLTALRDPFGPVSTARHHRAAARRLEELVGPFGDHRLLLFTEGAAFEAPDTGRLRPFVSTFSAWPERAFLTPRPVAEWGRREVDLAASGLRVVPASTAGLSAFVESLHSPGEPVTPREAPEEAPFPELLVERAGRYLERVGPEDTEGDALLAQLRRYLGEQGLRWLAALAVYPALDWFLTLQLGLQLRTSSGEPVLSEARLLRLVRLPWLRHGALPDWLRHRLLTEVLSAGDEAALRQGLFKLLASPLEVPESRFRLHVVEPRSRGWGRFLVDLLRSEPADSPLRDHVFVEFMLGRRRRLQVVVPRRWHRYVYHRGLAAFGWRWEVLLLVALAGSSFGAVGGARFDAWVRSFEPSVIVESAAGDVEERPLAGRLRYIPAGTFTMGSPEGEEGRYDDEVQHEVTITRGFWMMETEVTQELWQEVMDGTGPAYFENCGEECPVERVNWYEAVAFANRLSAREGLEACYAVEGCLGNLGSGCPDEDSFYCRGDYSCESVSFLGFSCAGYRLPSEAEWELAARSGSEEAIYEGAWEILDEVNAPVLDPIAWYRGNSGVTYSGAWDCSDWEGRQSEASQCGTHRVGTKRANSWGLHDMLGNVYEWTWDEYGAYPVSEIVNPYGIAGGSSRVIRGGSWFVRARYCRAAFRYGWHPGDRGHDVGFRLVRTASP